MKKSKKIVALLMALVMCLSFSTSVFASEIPEVEKHTITFEIPASDESGVQPRIWNDPYFNLGSNVTLFTSSFVIPDRYFAYETRATNSNGNAISGSYIVDLMYEGNSVTYMTKPIDGNTYKNDWIDVHAGKNYSFKITNGSSSSIIVYITYYSWA